MTKFLQFFFIFAAVLLFATPALAVCDPSLEWCAPTQPAPSGSPSSPLNASNVPQSKAGPLDAYRLTSGDGGMAIIADAARYFNFSPFTGFTPSALGPTGYGIRDNAGTLEVKNSGGDWSPIGASTSYWTQTGSAPDYKLFPTSLSSIVGFGTANPGDAKVQIHTSSPGDDNLLLTQEGVDSSVSLSVDALTRVSEVTSSPLLITNLYGPVKFRTQKLTLNNSGLTGSLYLATPGGCGSASAIVTNGSVSLCFLGGS